MGEPTTPHFYDFGTLGRVPGSQNQLFLSVETGYLNKSKNSQIISKFLIFIDLKILELQIVVNFRKKNRHQKNLTSRLIYNILEIWDMRSISIKKQEMVNW